MTNDPGAVAAIGLGRPGDRRRSGIDGRDIDVERRVVLGNTSPHASDRGQFGLRKGGRDTVRVVRVGVARPARLPVPCGVDERLSIEVEIYDSRRSRSAVERERSCRIDRRRFHAGGSLRSLGLLCRRLDIEKLILCVGEQCGVCQQVGTELSG